MKLPPLLDQSQLEPMSGDSTVRPNFLGFTPRSWLELVAKNGPVYRLQQGEKETYLLAGHEADLAAWRAPSNWLYGPPSSGGEFFRAEMGASHVTQLDGDAHRRVRKLILPAFGVAAVTRDLDVVDRTLWSGLSGWGSQEIDLHPALSRLIATALTRSQLKETLSADDIDQLVTFEEAFIPAVSLSPSDREKWYRQPFYEAARRRAFDVFEGVARQRLAGVSQQDSLDLVLGRQRSAELAPLTEDELVSAAYLLSVAGVGNIANILCAALWAIGRHDSWKSRLRDELQDFQAEDLKQGMGAFPVLRAVISEVERCYLPAPVIPKMTAMPVNFMGFDIPGGADVLHLHGLAHFEPDRYPAPFEFNPQRWLDGEAVRANAFGGGIHLCLGMGVTRLYVPLILAQLVCAYDWTVVAEPRLVPQRPQLDFSPMTTLFTSKFTPV